MSALIDFVEKMLLRRRDISDSVSLEPSRLPS